jgi:DNA ligase-1
MTTKLPIPDFPGVQLAHEYTGWPKHHEGGVFVEPKYDGYALLATFQRGRRPAFFTRTGNHEPYTDNLQFILDQLAPMFVGNMTAIHGEIMVTDWNGTGAIRRKNPDAATRELLRKHCRFHLFDAVWELPGRNDFRDGLFHVAQLDRRRMLEDWFDDAQALGATNLTLAPQVRCTSDAEVQAAHVKHLLEGYEGSMVKLPAAPYRPDRSHAWLKVKPSKTIDLTVVGMIEGEGKHVGRLGALECRLTNGDKVNVGTGLTDAQREEFWKLGPAMNGTVIEVEVQANTTVGVARHPSFLRVRPPGV